MKSLQNLIVIQDADLVNLLASRRPELEVGILPYEVRKYFGCSRETIYLSDQSIRHIFQKHGEHISNKELKLLPEILAAGLWLNDDRTTHAIATCEIKGTRYKCVIKVTVDRRRTYVKTLHSLAPKKAKRLMRRAKKLRGSWF